MDIRTVLENVKLGDEGLAELQDLSNHNWFIECWMDDMGINADTPALKVVDTLLKYDGCFHLEASKIAFFALDKSVPWLRIWKDWFGW